MEDSNTDIRGEMYGKKRRIWNAVLWITDSIKYRAENVISGLLKDVEFVCICGCLCECVTILTH